MLKGGFGKMAETSKQTNKKSYSPINDVTLWVVLFVFLTDHNFPLSQISSEDCNSFFLPDSNFQKYIWSLL